MAVEFPIKLDEFDHTDVLNELTAEGEGLDHALDVAMRAHSRQWKEIADRRRAWWNALYLRYGIDRSQKLIMQFNDGTYTIVLDERSHS
jgi:hypothetical protein